MGCLPMSMLALQGRDICVLWKLIMARGFSRLRNPSDTAAPMISQPVGEGHARQP